MLCCMLSYLVKLHALPNSMKSQNALSAENYKFAKRLQKREHKFVFSSRSYGVVSFATPEISGDRACTKPLQLDHHCEVSPVALLQ